MFMTLMDAIAWLVVTSTKLADSGATPHEIMAITGHQSLKEVERYTKAVNRRKTADAAMAKLQGGSNE